MPKVCNGLWKAFYKTQKKMSHDISLYSNMPKVYNGQWKANKKYHKTRVCTTT